MSKYTCSVRGDPIGFDFAEYAPEMGKCISILASFTAHETQDSICAKLRPFYDPRQDTVRRARRRTKCDDSDDCDFPKTYKSCHIGSRDSGRKGRKVRKSSKNKTRRH